MPRIKLPEPADMTDAQRAVYGTVVAGKRGRAPAPFLAWLANPEMADRAQKLGELVRYDTTLPPRLSELAILAVARFWSSEYEWFAHKKEALKAGLDAGIIADIAARRPPRLVNRDEQAVYDFTVALNEMRQVTDERYRAAVDAIGDRAVVELVTLIGYYTLIAMTLNVFEICVPDGVEPELGP